MRTLGDAYHKGIGISLAFNPEISALQVQIKSVLVNIMLGEKPCGGLASQSREYC